MFGFWAVPGGAWCAGVAQPLTDDQAVDFLRSSGRHYQSSKQADLRGEGGAEAVKAAVDEAKVELGVRVDAQLGRACSCCKRLTSMCRYDHRRAWGCTDALPSCLHGAARPEPGARSRSTGRGC